MQNTFHRFRRVYFHLLFFSLVQLKIVELDVWLFVSNNKYLFSTLFSKNKNALKSMCCNSGLLTINLNSDFDKYMHLCLPTYL